MTSLIIFDWNGTVLNDEKAAVRGFAKILNKLNDMRPATAELHAEHFQIPVTQMYASLGYVDMEPTIRKTLSELWENEYWEHQTSSDLQPGIAETVAWLEANKLNRVVLSNYIVSRIEQQLVRFDLRFDAVLANNYSHDAHKTSKQSRLETYLRENNLDPKSVIIIGDSTEEIQIARRLNARSIALANGWTRVDRLRAENPDYLINSSHLPSLIQELVNA